MHDQTSLYDLFEETSLLNCKRLLDQGQIPTPQQLADILKANADRPLPGWFIDLVANSLTGKLKRKAGRPKQSIIASMMVFDGATHNYHALLAWLTRREKTQGLTGWSILQDKDWWSGPPHERAARIAVRRGRLHMSWQSFLNRVSSKK